MNSKASIKEIEQSLIEDFDLLENSEEKYEYLIEIGMNLPAMEANLKTEDRLVHGCQSSVWFDIHCEDGKIVFVADSDSMIVRGMVAILDKLLNLQPLEAVLQADMNIFESLELTNLISSQRSNGLIAMMAHLKQAAAECLDKAT